MNKIKIIAILAVMIFCLGTFAAGAETQPVQSPGIQAVQTEPVQTPATVPVQTPVTQPDATEPAVTQPAGQTPTDPVVNPTGATVPASGVVGTDPTGVTDPSYTQATEPTTFVRPSEIVTEPATYSNYVSPAPIYTPGNQDFNKNEWENIELDLSADKNSDNGAGSFLNIKNNNSTKDEKNPLLLILTFVFWFLAISAITFLILYRPEKKRAYAKVKTVESDNTKIREKSPQYEKKYSDDYDDGF